MSFGRCRGEEGRKKHVYKYSFVEEEEIRKLLDKKGVILVARYRVMLAAVKKGRKEGKYPFHLNVILFSKACTVSVSPLFSRPVSMSDGRYQREEEEVIRKFLYKKGVILVA